MFRAHSLGFALYFRTSQSRCRYRWNHGLSGQRPVLMTNSVQLTQMQMEPRVQAFPAPVLDQVLCCLECPEILIALANSFVLPAAIVAISHQDGYLCAQLRQLERTCSMSVLPLPCCNSCAYKLSP
jgi:hypothetical protein